MEAPPSYVYKPLARDDSFRILYLAPGSGDDELVCRLETVFFDDLPKYEAVSYTWGDGSMTRSLRCGPSQQLSIAENAWLALTQLRHQSNPRPLWLDAICINQIDVSERNQQVKIMRYIYSNAASVLIWLGIHMDGSDAVMDIMPELARAQDVCREAIEEVFPPRTMPSLASFHSWGAVFSFFDRPWFRRIWVVQEVALATKVMLLCGEDAVDWKDVVQAARFLSRSNLGHGQSNMLFRRPIDIEHARLMQHRNQTPQLVNHLSQFRSWLSTDTRDKVFGLLGILNPDNAVVSEGLVDYNLSREEIFKRVAMLIIKTDHNLDLLAACTHSRNRSDLPFWVPDWGQHLSFETVLALELPNNPKRDYNAPKGVKWDPCFSQDERRLGVSGYLVDRVVSVGKTFEHFRTKTPGTGTVGYDENYTVVRDFSLSLIADTKMIRPLTKRHKKYVTGEPWLEARWNTHLAGWLHIFDGKPMFRMYDFMMSIYVLDGHLRHLGFKSLSEVYLKIFSVLIGPKRFRYFKEEALKLGQAHMLWGRRFMITERGYIGLVPETTIVGDKIGLFKGCRTPLIVKEKEAGLRFVGCGYVHGMMHGEEWDEKKCNFFWLE